MVEMLSPLKTRLQPGSYGAAGAAGITMGTCRTGGLWQIAGWDSFEAAAAPVLDTLGLGAAGDFRSCGQSSEATAWRVAPDRILIRSSADLSGFMSEQLAVLDLGHARTVITLSGPAARDLLSQVIAVDTAPAAFGPGEFRQTGIHHVGVLIHCTGPGSFELLVPCTWAETVWEVLFDNALPHGVAVGEAA
ncbi:MAG: sarcosine oxidase subunit gamma [Leisingera sp.]